MKHVLVKKLFQIALTTHFVKLINGVDLNETQYLHTEVRLISNGSEISEMLPPPYEIFENQIFQIKCRSNFPVFLKFDGPLFSVVKNAYSKRTGDFLIPSTYCYEVKVTVISKTEATGRYSCVKYSSENEASSVYIFANYTKTPHLLHLNTGQDVLPAFIQSKQLILPCLITNSNISLKLFENGRDITKKPGVEYEPTVGFIIHGVSEQNKSIHEIIYTCMEKALATEEIYNVTVKLPHPIIYGDKAKNITIKHFKGKNDTNQLECLGATSMAFVKCNSSLECEFSKSCLTFNQQLSCGYNNDSCSEETGSCEAEVPKFFNGAVFCKNDETVLRKLFFTNLLEELEDGENFQDRNIIKFDDFQHDEWEDENFGFEESKNIQCESSKWTTSSKPYIFLEFENGTRLMLEGDFTRTNLTRISLENISSYVETAEFFPQDTSIVKLLCFAPKQNSSGWYNISRQIKVLDPPTIVMNETSPEIGEIYNNASLSCTATNMNGSPGFPFAWSILINNEWKTAGAESSNRSKNSATTFLELNSSLVPTPNPIIYKCNASDPRRASWAAKFFIIISEGDKFYLTNKTDDIGEQFNNILSTSQFSVDTQQSAFSQIIPIIIPLVCFIILGGTIKLAVWTNKQRRRNNDPEYQKLRDCVNNFIDGKKPVVSFTDKPFQKKKYFIPKKYINIDETVEALEGNFGVVRPAVSRNGMFACFPSFFENKELKLAVKILKPRSDGTFPTLENFEEFLKEIKMLQHVGDNHLHIAKFYGIVASKQSLLKMDAKIVFEYYPYNLKSYLCRVANNLETTTLTIDTTSSGVPPSNNLETLVIDTTTKIDATSNAVTDYCSLGVLTESVKAPEEPKVQFRFEENGNSTTITVTHAERIQWCLEISEAMEYLIKNKIIHRDLAARNVLLQPVEDQKLVVKVSDFGLSRVLYKKETITNLYYYVLTSDIPMPIKWMSPEALQHKRFTKYSDIWSFGVTMWEIFTNCSDPYPEITGTGRKQLINLKHYLIRKEKRLKRPELATTKLYKIMRDCWHKDKFQRASFTKLKEKLKLRLQKYNNKESDSEISDGFESDEESGDDERSLQSNEESIQFDEDSHESDEEMQQSD